MLGKLSKNKTFLLLKKFQYLPDSYKYFTDDNVLLTTRNKAITQSGMYVFHTLPEEAIATTIMIAQLKNMKMPNGTTIWDMYDVVRKEENGAVYYDVE